MPILQHLYEKGKINYVLLRGRAYLVQSNQLIAVVHLLDHSNQRGSQRFHTLNGRIHHEQHIEVDAMLPNIVSHFKIFTIN